MKKFFPLWTVLLCLFGQQTAAYAEDFRVSSPDGQLCVTVHLTDGRIDYDVARGERSLVERSPLGLVAEETDLSRGLSFVSESLGEVNDEYTLPSGKTSHYTDRCRQLLLSLRNEDGVSLWVFFRVYDDGFAFRYTVGRAAGTERLTIVDDPSRVRVADFEYCLGSKFLGGVNSPNYPYESYYRRYDWTEVLTAQGDPRLNAPALISNGTDYLLVSEAANDGGFSASLLRGEEREGEFSFRYAGNTKDFAADGPQRLTLPLPLHTPWRMVITGSLPVIFQSTMAENLCPPSVLSDTQWIRPGRAAWDWGGSDGCGYAPLTREGADSLYIDLAARMGWEYMLVDGGWKPETIRQTVNYATSRGIKVLLWQTAALRHSQEFSNERMDETLTRWEEWGIAGIKIDFWEDDSQETLQRMENLLRCAAKHRMVVNFHGCTRPSGLRRTYPHLLSYEAVLGGEQNFWNPQRDMAMTAEHHINLFLTRNVIGPADFTPGDFALRAGTLISNVSQAQRMGLLVGFENGLLHVCESPENLEYFMGLDVMKRVPATWDESRLLEAEVQQYATIARRSGEEWWLAGATVGERTARISLDFLPKGKRYTAYIYRDGECRTEMRFEKRRVTRGSTLHLPEMNGGGFLVQLSPDDHLPVPVEAVTYEAEARQNTLSEGVTRRKADALYASGGEMVGDLGRGRELTFRNIKAGREGDYVLTIYYSTYDDRRAELMVNGQPMGMQTFRGNGASYKTYGPEGLGWYKLRVRLHAGKNTVAIRAPQDGWAPDVDRITLCPIGE